MEAPRAVEAGREALGGRTKFPWYDAEQDALRRIDVKTPREASENRNSTWQAKPSQPRPTTTRNWSGLGWLWQIIQTLFWMGLIALLALLVYLLVRAYVTYEHAEETPAPVPESRTEADLIESLPFQVSRPQTDLLGAARGYYEEGAYDKAIVYLYSYQLVKLDQHHAIRLARGKTNRQYLRELVSRPDLHGMLERTMVAFEDVFFGHHALPRDRFEACWSRLDDFHRRLEF
jgi:hypothetical protein